VSKQETVRVLNDLFPAGGSTATTDIVTRHDEVDNKKMVIFQNTSIRLFEQGLS
jgi:hypothetical protein